jgi:hypothetical protein
LPETIMSVFLRRAAALAALIVLFGSTTAFAAANVKITEFMYNSPGGGGEFIEITNVGDAAQDLTGWSFDDNHRLPGTFSLTPIGTLLPGESGIITESTAADFIAAWNLCTATKIAGGNTFNLGDGDEINIYDNTNAQVDRLTYPAKATAGALNTSGVSGIPKSAAALGANDITQWKSSVVGDAENSITSTKGDIGSPGFSTLITSGHATCAAAGVRITEYMYNSAGTGGEFVEITNIGNTPQDLTGWSFDDSHRTAGHFSLNPIGSLAAGESALITEAVDTNFRATWNLCPAVKIAGGNGSDNLGNGDEINIYDNTGAQVDQLTYPASPPGTLKTSGFSGIPMTAAALGANDISLWKLSVIGDAEASYQSAQGDVGSPGKSTLALHAFDPCVSTPGAPTISIDTTTTSPRLDLSTNGIGTASGVIGDPTDPASTVGIGFTLTSTDSTLVVTATSSNLTVVPATGLVLTSTATTAHLTITPVAVGYSTITVRVTDTTNREGIYTVDYAASATSPTPATSRFFTGTSDTSTGIMLDADTMLVADDENQGLRTYSRDDSGWPLAIADFTTQLELTDISGGVPREVDIEASAQLGNRVFWSGSHSNSDDGDVRVDRRRVFATDVSGTGAATTLTYQGRYDFLLDDLVAWDHANGHGLGVDALGFTAGTAAGAGAKQANGFNIEGMTIAPDNTSAYMAFRAPLLPTSARTMALIVPVANIDSLVTGNGATGSRALGSATFGAPIFLDLAGRGIREITRNNVGQYLIIAGPPGDDTGIALADFRLFTWTGNATDKPIELDTDLTSLQARGSWETIIGFPDTVGPATPVQLLVDNGDTAWYGDNVAAKDLGVAQLKKFRGDRLDINVPLASDVLFRDGFDQR